LFNRSTSTAAEIAMESKSIVATRILQDFFISLHLPYPWCYVPRLVESDHDSLAHLLGIDLESLDALFLACGILYSHGKTVRFSNQRFKSILCNLRADIEVEKARPSGFTTLTVFIKLGQGCWTASEQYREGRKKGVPPRHTRQVKNSQRQLADALAVEFFGVEKEDEIDDIPDRPPPSHITAPQTPADNNTTLTSHAPRTPSSGTTAGKVMMSTMYEMRLISEHVNPKYLASDDFWAEGSSEGAFEKALEMHAAAEREKSSLTSHVRGLLGIKKIEDTLDHADYPTLVGQLRVNLKDNQTIQALLRDIIKLSKNVESVKILEFQAGNDKLQSLIHVPRSSRVDLFNKNAVRSGWVLKVLNAIIPPADNVNNEPPVDDDMLDVEK
jgi:hypothetical protein